MVCWAVSPDQGGDLTSARVYWTDAKPFWPQESVKRQQVANFMYNFAMGVGVGVTLR